jgi:hypothetical protein
LQKNCQPVRDTYADVAFWWRYLTGIGRRCLSTTGRKAC